MSKEYYVYACLVKGVLVYVGKGKGNRYLHCTSGTSSCMELNRDLFKYGAHNFKVIKVVDRLTEQEAFAMEKAVLLSEQQESTLYNKTYGLNSKQEWDQNLVNEFWCYYGYSQIPGYKWQDENLFSD
jgi:hypothetical protein